MVIEGIKGVLIPSAPIYEISKSKITQLSLEQEVDSTAVKLGDDDSVQKKWSEMFASMQGPTATGKFHQMFASPPPLAVAGAGPSSSSICAPAFSSGGFLGGGDALGLSISEVHREAEEAQEEEESDDGQPAKKKARQPKGIRTVSKKGTAPVDSGKGKGKSGPGRPKRDLVKTGTDWLDEAIAKPRSQVSK